jgi:hypothetical protein
MKYRIYTPTYWTSNKRNKMMIIKHINNLDYVHTKYFMRSRLLTLNIINLEASMTFTNSLFRQGKGKEWILSKRSLMVKKKQKNSQSKKKNRFLLFYQMIFKKIYQKRTKEITSFKLLLLKMSQLKIIKKILFRQVANK